MISELRERARLNLYYLYLVAMWISMIKKIDIMDMRAIKLTMLDP